MVEGEVNANRCGSGSIQYQRADQRWLLAAWLPNIVFIAAGIAFLPSVE